MEKKNAKIKINSFPFNNKNNISIKAMINININTFLLLLSLKSKDFLFQNNKLLIKKQTFFEKKFEREFIKNKIYYDSVILKIKNNKKNLDNYNNSKNQILNFKNLKSNNINLSKHLIISNQNLFFCKNKCALKIQKIYKGYITRKVFYQIISNKIMNRIIFLLILIQKNIRRYLIKKHLKQAILIKNILFQRKINFKIIEKYIYKYYKKNKIKKFCFYLKILSFRLNKIIFIQRYFKSSLTYSLAHNILNLQKTHYYLEYYSINQNIKSVKLKLYKFYNNLYLTSNNSFYRNLNDQYTTYDFIYCKLRKIFVLYLYNENIKPDKYRCQFIIDGKTKIDKRFSTINYNNNTFNIIKFTEGKNDLISYNKNIFKNKDNKVLNDNNNRKIKSYNKQSNNSKSSEKSLLLTKIDLLLEDYINKKNKRNKKNNLIYSWYS